MWGCSRESRRFNLVRRSSHEISGDFCGKDWREIRHSARTIMSDPDATLTQHKGSPPVAKEEAERVTPEKAKPTPFKSASLSSNAFGKRFRDKIEIVCTCPALARHVLPMSRDRPMCLVTAYVPAGVVGFEAR